MIDLDLACEHFRKLLTEQQERLANMNAEKVDYTAKKVVTIGIIDGDGIGPIIMKQALRVLENLLADELAAGSIVLKKIEGLTIENRLALNKSVPEDVLAAIKSCDVLLKGPTTTPKGGKMESANVTLRRELDLYANVRPVCIPEQGIDWMFYRENTEGEYVLGSKGIDLPGMAVDFKVTTDLGTRRIARAAFDYARQNGKTRVSVVTKANIMKKTDGKFSAICQEIAAEYPEITTDEWYIDIMTANLVNESIRNQFQVFLLPNLYGDIITDEAAQIQGGVGTAGSANIGDRFAMFEAIHGSAPRMLEEGLGDYASPASILKASAMLLRHIGRTEKAQRLERALSENPLTVTGDKNGATGEAFTSQLLEIL
jgi:isocitrate dehydrogenase (NAD+)